MTIKLQVGDVVELDNGDICLISAYFKYNETYGGAASFWNEDGSVAMVGYDIPKVVRVIRNALSPLNEGKV